MAETEDWEATDRFLEGLLLPPDPALDAALRDSEAAGLPSIQVSPLQGQGLYVLALASGARRVLEIGTLGGYSTICLARALPPGGRLISLELNPRHAEVARANLQRAGLDQRVEVRIGPALDLLAALLTEHAAPFDLAFIDADKPNVVGYFDRARRLVRPGGLIIVDNVVRRGEIRDPESPDPNVQATRQLLLHLAEDRSDRATVLQTVGRKGHDGWAIVVVGESGQEGTTPSKGTPSG